MGASPTSKLHTRIDSRIAVCTGDPLDQIGVVVESDFMGDKGITSQISGFIHLDSFDGEAVEILADRGKKRILSLRMILSE